MWKNYTQKTSNKGLFFIERYRKYFHHDSRSRKRRLIRESVAYKEFPETAALSSRGIQAVSGRRCFPRGRGRKISTPPAPWRFSAQGAPMERGIKRRRFHGRGAWPAPRGVRSAVLNGASRWFPRTAAPDASSFSAKPLRLHLSWHQDPIVEIEHDGGIVAPLGVLIGKA